MSSPPRWRQPRLWPGLGRGLWLLARRELHRRRDRLSAMERVNPAGPDLVALLDRHASSISQCSGEAAAAMFREQMLNTWETTLNRLDDGSVFVITGDIPAMWLRDSSAQLRPFLALAPESDEISDLIAQVVDRQWACIAIDNYANAFNAEPNGASWHASDLCDNPWVWEQKYEIDSLTFPIQLAWQLWQATGRTDHLVRVRDGAWRVIEVWRLEQQHEARSSYRFVRPGTDDTLGADGSGTPVAVTGMTWSGFRPSDDACRYHYNIPAQLFAVHALGLLSQIATEVFADTELATAATTLAAEINAGIETHGLLEDDTFAYEVDGLGQQLAMDDANMPSLLSLPLCSDLARDDQRYLATRARVLSQVNPYFHVGTHAQGIGSPHTPPGYIWPIALAVQGLTSTDEDEKDDLIATLVATTGGTGLMHEGFDPNDPTRFTRPWFSWANSMFCELLLERTGRSLPLGEALNRRVDPAHLGEAGEVGVG